MSLAEYSVPIEDGMRVRHDAQARITVSTGKKILEDRLTGVGSIGGALTVASVTYNGLSASGGVGWRNPVTGDPITRPNVRLRVRRGDVLTGEQECTCPECSTP